MQGSVADYIDKCDTCAVRKAERLKPAGSMSSIEAFEPFETIAIDCMGPIAATMRDNKHIIVAVDTFTRFVEAQAVPEISGPRFAEFLTNFCGRFGLPKAILTDDASTFTNSMVKEVNKAYGIQHLKAAPHHSR